MRTVTKDSWETKAHRSYFLYVSHGFWVWYRAQIMTHPTLQALKLILEHEHLTLTRSTICCRHWSLHHWPFLLTFAERILCSHRKKQLITTTYCASFTRCCCYLLASFQAVDFNSCPLTCCEPSWHHSVMQFHLFILLNASHVQTDKMDPFISFLTKEHMLMELQHAWCDLSNFLSPSAFKVETHPQEIWLFYSEQLED